MWHPINYGIFSHRLVELIRAEPLHRETPIVAVYTYPRFNVKASQGFYKERGIPLLEGETLSWDSFPQYLVRKVR